MKDVFIIDAIRTPVGKAPRGVFKNTLPDDLLIKVLKEIKTRHQNIPWENLGDVLIGCAMPEAEQGMNVARIASLLAGFPEQVPAMTINRFCSSGVQTIATAANAIITGDMDMAIAGGVESMSKVPMGGNKYTANSKVFADEHIGIAYGMGLTAEIVAKKWNISREEQDKFATDSHLKALQAQKEGYFDSEIIPVEIEDKALDFNASQIIHTKHTVTQDEGPRKDTSFEMISKLRPVFAQKGTVTAGNSSQMSDGAGVTFLANEDCVKTYHLKPIGKLLSYAVAGVLPEQMGIGPVEAIPKALKKAGLTIQDIDWIELNEAFAAQTLAVIKELELPIERVNPLGGAIALGHPLGATGAIRTATMLHGLKRTGGRYGMVTMCIGTGMGAAAIFESL